MVNFSAFSYRMLSVAAVVSMATFIAVGQPLPASALSSSTQLVANNSLSSSQSLTKQATSHTVSNLSTAADSDFISLSWDGKNYVSDTTQPFFVRQKAFPGSSDGSHIKIKNNGPNDGRLQAKIVEVKTTVDGQSNPSDQFFRDASAVWKGAFGNGSTSFTQLSSSTDGNTLVGEIPLKKGEVVDVGFGYRMDDASNSYLSSNSRIGSYKVNFTLSGADVVAPVSAISLSVVGNLIDKDGDKLADAGESIEWVFTVKNTGNTSLDDIKIISDYLKSKGVTAQCEATTLAPGATTTCRATTSVDAAEVKQGKIELTAVVQSKDSSSAPVSSQTATAIVLTDVSGTGNNPTPTATPSPQNPTSSPSPSTNPSPNPVGTTSPPQQVGDNNTNNPSTTDNTDGNNNPSGRVDSGELNNTVSTALMSIGIFLMVLGFMVLLWVFLRRRKDEKENDATGSVE